MDTSMPNILFSICSGRAYVFQLTRLRHNPYLSINNQIDYFVILKKRSFPNNEGGISNEFLEHSGRSKSKKMF